MNKHYYLASLLALFIFLIIAPQPVSASLPSKIPLDMKKALQAGLEWRQSDGGQQALMDNVLSVYNDYGYWIWLYRGNRPPLDIALMIWVESKGYALAKTKDIYLGEVGLMSVKRKTAKNYNINACHPQQNIWGAQKIWHENRWQLVEKVFPFVTDYEQQFLMVELMGAIGTGVTMDLAYKVWGEPMLYDAILAWTRNNVNKIKDMKLGHQTPQQVAFRIGLVEAKHKLILKYQKDKYCNNINGFNEEKPYPEIIFPGGKLHRKCEQLFNDYKDIYPTIEEQKEWREELKTVDCEPLVW